MGDPKIAPRPRRPSRTLEGSQHRWVCYAMTAAENGVRVLIWPRTFLSPAVEPRRVFLAAHDRALIAFTAAAMEWALRNVLAEGIRL